MKDLIKRAIGDISAEFLSLAMWRDLHVCVVTLAQLSLVLLRLVALFHALSLSLTPRPASHALTLTLLQWPYPLLRTHKLDEQLQPGAPSMRYPS